MKKHHILFWLQTPSSPTGTQQQKYRECVRDLETRSQELSKCSVSNGTFWLVPQEDAAEILYILVSAAKEYDVPYGVRFLHEE